MPMAGTAPTSLGSCSWLSGCIYPPPPQLAAPSGPMGEMAGAPHRPWHKRLLFPPSPGSVKPVALAGWQQSPSQWQLPMEHPDVYLCYKSYHQIPFKQWVLCFPQLFWPMVEPYILYNPGKAKKNLRKKTTKTTKKCHQAPTFSNRPKTGITLDK